MKYNDVSQTATICLFFCLEMIKTQSCIDRTHYLYQALAIQRVLVIVIGDLVSSVDLLIITKNQLSYSGVRNVLSKANSPTRKP